MNIFFTKISLAFVLLQSHLLLCVTSASRYITSASHYHPRCQIRSSMYIRSLIPQNLAELAKLV